MPRVQSFRRPLFCSCILALVGSSALALPLAAQVGGAPGSVYVRVVDFENEQPVYQAEVRLVIFARGAFVDRAFTGGDGNVYFDSVERGNYIVGVEAQGYETASQDIDVSPNMALRVTVRLRRKLGVEYTPPPGSPMPVAGYVIPDAARKEFEKGRKKLQEGKAGDSIGHFRKAIEKYPEYAEAHTLLGLALLQKREELQRAPLESAVGAEGGESGAGANAAGGLGVSGEAASTGGLDSSSEWEQQRLRADRNKALAGLISEALGSLQKAVELNPQLAQAHKLLGQAELDQKNYSEAEKHLLESVQLDSQDGQAHLHLARCYYERAVASGSGADLSKALTHARRAHELPQVSPTIHLLLANIYFGQGNAKDALRELEEFVGQNPNNPLVPQVKQAMERVRSEIR